MNTNTKICFTQFVGFFKNPFCAIIELDTTFNNLKSILIKNRSNHFEKVKITLDFIQYDYMDDGLYSKLNMHRIKLYTFKVRREDESNGRIKCTFKLYKAALLLILLPVILVSFINFSEPEMFFKIPHYLIICFVVGFLAFLFVKAIFLAQIECLKSDLNEAINKNLNKQA